MRTGGTVGRRAALSMLVVAVGVALGGCGSSGHGQSTPTYRDETYLATAPNAVRVLQLTIDGANGVFGSLTVDQILPSDPSHQGVSTTNLTGTDQNSRFMLQPSGSSVLWIGERRGSRLRLQYVLDDGTHVTTTFVRSDISAYDHATQALRQQADQAAGQADAVADPSPAARRTAARALGGAGAPQASANARGQKQGSAQARAAAAHASANAAALNRVRAAANAAARKAK